MIHYQLMKGDIPLRKKIISDLKNSIEAIPMGLLTPKKSP